MEPNVLCILGMHRSGTSLTASWLQACGLEIGEQLLKADFSNRKGHFEDQDFLLLHKEILADLGVGDTGLVVTGRPAMNQNHREKIKALIEFKSSENIQWGWKEPRTCLFISEYLTLIPRLKVIYIYRPANQIIASLVNRRLGHMIIENSNNRFIWRQLGKLSFRLNLGKNKKELVKVYRKTLVTYLQSVLSALESMPRQNLQIYSIDELISSSKLIFQTLTNELELELEYKDVSDSFDDSSLGRNRFNVNFESDDEILNLENRIIQLKRTR